MPAARPPPGDVSPALSNIRVGKRPSTSPMEGPRQKKLKLTVRNPTNSSNETNVAPRRPKRKSGRPARYSDEPAVEQKPHHSPITSVISATLTTENATFGPEEDSEPSDKPAPYSADFLAMYIEGGSPAPSATPEPKVEENDRFDEPATTTINPLDLRTVHQPVEQGTATTSTSPTPGFPAEQPQTFDNPETIMKKLSVAVHALSALNIPAPRPSSMLSPEPRSKPGLSAVDALFSAAGEGGSDPALQTPSSHIGLPDTDLKFLIQHALHLLRTSLVTKVQYQASVSKPRGRPKRDVGLTARIEADRFAMSALEEVSKSNALSINCIISPQRAHLTWHLCASLIYLITPPPMPHMQQIQQIQQMQQRPVHMFAQGSQVPLGNFVPAEAAITAAQAHQQNGAQGPPPPHQFLFRNPHSGPGLPMETNGTMLNHVQVFAPGYLPRSGQSMKFSFPPSGVRFGQDGSVMGVGAPVEMAPVGVQYTVAPGISPGSPVLAKRPVGYPHPGTRIQVVRP